MIDYKFGIGWLILIIGLVLVSAAGMVFLWPLLAAVALFMIYKFHKDSMNNKFYRKVIEMIKGVFKR